ncbi:oxygen-independent coproporphyrinogen III oxidase [Pacificimonas flava]|uniref:Coproporphyrinogen-III oxidase n=2 Tax=Pacificimonas TaxID=1960290 RepID=A0A219B241_9SPHN|nr:MULTISPECIES: oxygen-independent coproporphyrinogen III oxidase [Pacificimonas]MBZ6379645.1 oxygen-independent coproporphyrinogen III oxidase [Pacificimonas aurantium]OWV31888.1 oxygen-independent coproporphyrinogen III oxidase [Pacificimonas flava]
MWTYHPDLLARPVPRYTSFPTAAEFSDTVGRAEQENAIASLPRGVDVSLYLHIPFCEQICWYCGCNTARANRAARVSAYLSALEREIAAVGALLYEKDIRVGRVSFGGGSPNAVRPYEFLRLLREVTLAFGATAPLISVEIDPRSFSEEWAALFADAGIANASLGVQTFSPKLQEAIGRIQPPHLIEQCTHHLRRAGVSSLNFDLMYGLPGQTQDDLADSLRRAVELTPDRIALFGYAHVPQLMPRQRQIDAVQLPGQEERFQMAAFGFDLLRDAGYVPVGFDHFALPADPLARAASEGTLRRNFQGFTDDQADVLIGLGASAISQFPGLIVQNEKNSGRYRMRLSAGQLSGARGVRRHEEDQWRGAVIEDILCRGEADLSVLPYSPSERGRLVPFAEKNLVMVEKDYLAVLPDGLPYARTVAAIFDPYRKAVAREFSNAV